MTKLPRRKALLCGLQVLSAAIVLLLTTRGAKADDACVDHRPNHFAPRSTIRIRPRSRAVMRRLRIFTMEKAPCGTCMLAKGAVSSKGHCDSWSDRNG